MGRRGSLSYYDTRLDPKRRGMSAKNKRLYVREPGLGRQACLQRGLGRRTVTFPVMTSKVRMQTSQCSENESGESHSHENHAEAESALSETRGSKPSSAEVQTEKVTVAADQKKAALLKAEEELRHNWVLSEGLKEAERRFNYRQHILTVTVPDDDPLIAIETRLDEVRRMTKPRKVEESVLQNVEPNRRELIMVRTPLQHRSALIHARLPEIDGFTDFCVTYLLSKTKDYSLW